MNKNANIKINVETIDAESDLPQTKTTIEVDYVKGETKFTEQKEYFETEHAKEALLDFIDDLFYDKPTLEQLINHPQHISQNKSYIGKVLSEYNLQYVDSYTQEDVRFGLEYGAVRSSYSDIIDLGEGVFCGQLLKDVLEKMLNDHPSLVGYYQKGSTVPLTLEYSLNNKYSLIIKIKFLNK